MLKFSRHSRDRSATMSEGGSPPDKPKVKRQKINDIVREIDPLKNQIEELKVVHAEFESFLDVVSSDLKEKVQKQKLLKDSDKNYYAGIQLFMLSKYGNRIERFRQVSRNNLNAITNLEIDKENADHSTISDYVNKHVETIGKMKRRSKQILDISDKYAVEDIFDNINLVNECSASLQPPQEAARTRKMSKWQSVGLMVSDTPDRDTFETHHPEFPDVSRQSSGSNTVRRHSKKSTILSLTDHLAVLTKTYTGRR